MTSTPKLCFTAGHYAALSAEPGDPFRKAIFDRLLKKADRFLLSPELAMRESEFNWHIHAARSMQDRLMTLLVAFRITGLDEFLAGALREFRRIAEFPHWSWRAWKTNDPSFLSHFDISYGEHSASLAWAFDALRGELSQSDRKLFVETARTRCFLPFLQRTSEAENREWWVNHPTTNQNAVNSGGAGMLALAMGDECEESAEVLKIASASIGHYLASFVGKGGWHEGVGYWTYGMRYSIYFLMSAENALGTEPEFLRRPAAAATLQFPLLFSPHRVECGFGDVNYFAALPFHYLAAMRMGSTAVAAEVKRRGVPDLEKIDAPGIDPYKIPHYFWPNEAEWALVTSEALPVDAEAHWPDSIFIGDRTNWGFLADSMPAPNLYLSVRGGELAHMGHTHRDLLSFNLLVGQEKLIENLPVDEYLDTTFSERREELYEISPLSKNGIFLNGVGISAAARTECSEVSGEGFRGIRMDATEAFGRVEDGGPPALFCGRLFLMLQKRAILILDEFHLRFPGVVESRFHTFESVESTESSALIRGTNNTLQLAIGSNEESFLKPGTGLPTHPARRPDSILRHVGRNKVSRCVLGTLLVPNGMGSLLLRESGDSWAIVSEWVDETGPLTMAFSVGNRLGEVHL